MMTSFGNNVELFNKTFLLTNSRINNNYNNNNNNFNNDNDYKNFTNQITLQFDNIIYNNMERNDFSYNNNNYVNTTAQIMCCDNQLINSSGSGSGNSSGVNNNVNKTDLPIIISELLDWKELFLVGMLCVLIVITVIGNTLVILAVITTRRLRTVTNCFVTSLAVADWLVGLFVMPPAIALKLMGSWQLGWIFCDIWISLDVLLCTASILSLCAISIDRYLAVTQPLNYSRRRRSKRLALLMIFIVWILALAITCPPILGWYEPGRRDLIECRYNQNEGYVVFSAMGSFFIPMAVMIYVYVRISCVIAARHDEMTEIEVHKTTTRCRDTELELDIDHDTSEHEQTSPRSKRLTTANVQHQQQQHPQTTNTITLNNKIEIIEQKEQKNGHYELVDSPRTPTSVKRNQTVTYKQTLNVDNNKWSSSNSGGQQCHHHHQHSVKSSNSTAEYCASKNMRVHQKSLSSRISSLKRENKTTQTLSIVVGGFIACWLPFFVYYLLTPFLPQDKQSAMVTSILTWLGWLNSAINPFIYAFYSVDFRAAFWRLTLRRFFKTTRKPPFTSNTVSIRR